MFSFKNPSDTGKSDTGYVFLPRETDIVTKGRKHMGALRPQKPLRLIRDVEVGRSEIVISNTYSLHCHHQNDSALRWAAV